MGQNKRNPLQAWGLMSAIVAQLVGCILIGIFAGKWLDQKWGTEPIFLIVGLLLGILAGTYGMIVSISKFNSGE